MSTSLDIVIVNWNAGDMLARCVDSVFASELGDVVLDRLVVVDNASSDGSATALSGYDDRFRLIASPINLGFAKACNLGARDSRADYLLFLNPDIVLDGDSLARAVAFMESPDHQDIWVSGIRLRDPAGKTARSCARLPTPLRMLAFGFGLDRLLPRLFPPHFMVEWDHEDTRDVEQVIGAFLLIRRTAFVRIEGFDERFFLYYEDVDLCRKVADAGGRLVHNASVSAMHVGGGTTERIKARRQFLSAQSRIRYAAKYFGRTQAALQMANGLVIEPLVRALRGLARRRPEEVKDALRASAMLFADLARDPAPFGRPAGTRRRVLALTRYPRQGASSRTRFLAFLPMLAEAGLEVTVAPFFDEDYLPALYAGRRQPPAALARAYVRRLVWLIRARSYDLIWLEKEALPWLPLFVEGAALAGRPLAVDFDDAWFRRYENHRSVLVRLLLGGKFKGLVQSAAVTLVGNAYLAGWAEKAGARRIEKLPTSVDLAHYPLPADKTRDGPVVVGWMGTPSTAASYLTPLLPTLAEAIEDGWARLRVVGAETPVLAAAGAEMRSWREDTEAAELADFDIGIMPLVPDPWSLGKCAYKLIQYMAMGLPVIASPVGMNTEVVIEGETGYLADGPQAWKDALRRLAGDPALRLAMGRAGRRLVEERYASTVVGQKLIETLKSLLVH